MFIKKIAFFKFNNLFLFFNKILKKFFIFHKLYIFFTKKNISIEIVLYTYILEIIKTNIYKKKEKFLKLLFRLIKKTKYFFIKKPKSFFINRFNKYFLLKKAIYSHVYYLFHFFIILFKFISI